MDSGLIYANARIKALEVRLLNNDKMLRMIDSASLEEAVKVLTESNYGGGLVIDNPSKFDSLLISEINSVNQLLKEIMPEGLGLEIFILRLDYHNAKAIMKAKYLKLESYNEMLEKNGLVDVDILSARILNDDYNDLYPHMKKALVEIDTAFVQGNRSPRLIDISLDKAYFNHASEIVSARGALSVKKYFTALADMTNISSFVRSRRASQNFKFFQQGYVSGGSLPMHLFESLYEASDEIAGDKFKYTEYKDIFNKVIEDKGRAMVSYETAMDNYLLNMFKNDRHDMFSVSPIAGYYLAKMTEIKVARMVLVCIKNNVDKLLIKQRLRELYA